MKLNNNRHCLNCGADLAGQFCHHCGEKVLHPKDKAFSSWMKETLLNLAQLDGKMITTIKSLVKAPGVMALDYARGKRVPYLKPLSLFLIANLLYFLLPSFNTFKSDLNTQMNYQIYSSYVEEAVNNYLAVSSMSMDDYAAIYDQKTVEVSKLIIIALAPLLGLIIFMLYAKKLYLTDAFNFALQFWSAFIFFYMLPFSLFSYFFVDFMIAQNWTFMLSESFLNITTILFVLCYLWFLLLELKEPKFLKLGKVLLLLAAMIPILNIYRAILFILTFALA